MNSVKKIHGGKSRKQVAILFHLVFCCLTLGYAQGEGKPQYVLEGSVFHGSIIRHNPDITHLITAHPGGFLLALNRKRFGEESWESLYNYPDTGFTFLYQNMNNPTLGEHYGLYAHYNFYFFKRQFQLRIGQGIAYNTNPYDRVTNFRNTAYGSHLLSSTLLMASYHRENIWKKLGLKAGISLIHYSNANFKAPNASTNTVAFQLGVNYSLDDTPREFIPPPIAIEKLKEPIAMNFVLRAGQNEGDVVGAGQFAFVTPSFYIDKRLGQKSAIQAGVDVFFSGFLRELIRFQSISFPENDVASDTDWKRVGVFIGHELRIDQMSVLTQLGYYAYYPFDFEGRVYNRIGIQRYFGDHWFGVVSLKSHAAAAEAVEFGIGYRL